MVNRTFKFHDSHNVCTQITDFIDPLELPSIRSLRVCLFVYLSARISQKSHVKISHVFCTCYLWPCLDPPLTAVRCVTYFRFCGWHHVSI